MQPVNCSWAGRQGQPRAAPACLGEKVLIAFTQKPADWGKPNSIPQTLSSLAQVVWDHPCNHAFGPEGAPIATTASPAPECPQVHRKFDLCRLSCGASAGSHQRWGELGARSLTQGQTEFTSKPLPLG